MTWQEKKKLEEQKLEREREQEMMDKERDLEKEQNKRGDRRGGGGETKSECFRNSQAI